MALKNLKVKPNPEKEVNGVAVQVDHPFQPGRKINKNGEEIQDCSYLQRRLKDGDLLFCDKKAQKAFDDKIKGNAGDNYNKAKEKLDEQLKDLSSAADISKDATAEEIQSLINDASNFGDEKAFAKHDGYSEKLEIVKNEVLEKLDAALQEAVKREAKGN